VGYFPVRVQEFLHVYRTRNLIKRVGGVYISETKCVCIGGREIKCLEGRRVHDKTNPLRNNSRRRGKVRGLEG
jgi:hypothetical protein